jgi:hypothetical protein
MQSPSEYIKEKLPWLKEAMDRVETEGRKVPDAELVYVVGALASVIVSVLGSKEHAALVFQELAYQLDRPS